MIGQILLWAKVNKLYGSLHGLIVYAEIRFDCLGRAVLFCLCSLLHPLFDFSVVDFIFPFCEWSLKAWCETVSMSSAECKSSDRPNKTYLIPLGKMN